MHSSTPYTVKGTILVVEDNEDIQELLVALLKQNGFSVMVASTGNEALSRLVEATPNLILLDMAMPDMDGLTFLNRRSQILDARDIPVIIVSARDKNRDVMAAIDMGADNYVTKPFDNAMLLASINRLFLPVS